MTGLRRSFRGELALRFGGTVLLAVSATSIFAYGAIREILFDQLDRTLLRMAVIEAAAASDTQDSTVHFHDEMFLTPAFGEEVGQGLYAEVWSLDGEPVVRTRNLGGRDLPLEMATRQRVAASLGPELFTFDWGETRYRSVLYPLGLIGAQHDAHVLQVAVSTSLTQGALHDFGRVLLLLTVLATVTGVALAWWIAAPVIRPVQEVIRQAETIEMSGGMHQISVKARTEEMERLVSVLNSMLHRIDAAFESQRRFLSEVGHELRTPLTVLRGDIEVALRKPRSDVEYAEILRQSLVDLKGVSELAQDLITLARGESGVLTPELEAFSTKSLLEDVAHKFSGVATESAARVTVSGDPTATAMGDPVLLGRAVEGLLDNALKYGGSEIRLETGVEDDATVWIRVSDDGPGIPEHEREGIFARFVRGSAGRKAIGGTGLGLSIVRAIVESHGGSVEFVTPVARGACALIRIPAAGDARDAWEEVDPVPSRPAELQRG